MGSQKHYPACLIWIEKVLRDCLFWIVLDNLSKRIVHDEDVDFTFYFLWDFLQNQANKSWSLGQIIKF